MFVEPEDIGRLALGEKQQVGLDAGVGIENAVGQPNDGMQVAFPQEQFLDLGLHPFTEQRAVRQDHRAASALILEQLLDDQHQKHVGGFPRLDIGRKIGADAIILHAAERWIGDDAIHALGKLPLIPRPSERITMLDHARHFDAV